ncbi:hypothetical protein [uncultured Gammaproteobacteria bacterium]|jgi:hypothetical protein|nr:hypothetical protein BROOK1789B_1170 [Bathymodiolus brooksi thiotrophic gill symbiont]CAC9616143.1 hypothetical protein [uncultured Gammaproteobacteria bacterium]CAC9629469.1 hypothetical protein [uncultured Gammaproteobacteria bacterium]
MKKTILFLTINIIFLATNYLLAQTCQDDTPDKWENSRYTDHGDGTVTDKQTTLMWKKCIQGLSGNDCSTGTSNKYYWTQALQLGGSSFSSYSDWRLPNKKELTSLLARRCREPSINESVFPNVPTTDSNFWSSSPANIENVGVSLMVNFSYSLENRIARDKSYYVRLVRSGQ